jgi:hypothetical protein
MCVQVELQVESKSSRWFGKGATSSIVTADVDIPDKVLEKRIHLAEVRAKRKSKAFLLRAFWASRAGARARAARRSGRRRTARFWVCCWYLRSSSQGFGRVEPRVCSNCRGQWSWSLSVLDWEVLSVMVASVDQYEDFRAPVRKSRKDSYPLLKNGLLCWKSAA